MKRSNEEVVICFVPFGDDRQLRRSFRGAAA
jgi:hypothetical protein